MSVLEKYRVTHQGKTWEVLFHSFSGGLYFWIVALTFKFPTRSIFTKIHSYQDREAEGQGGSLPWVPVVKGAWIFIVWYILLCKSCASSFAFGPSGTSLCP